MKPIALILLTALTLATAACVPVGDEITRQSTRDDPACIIAGTDCSGLHRTRASVW